MFGFLSVLVIWLAAVSAQRYDPATQNVYHLFTRQNPSISQPILNGNIAHLATTSFRADRNIIVLLHGWRGSGTSEDNQVLVPALLAAADVNLIVVDWSAGASLSSGGTGVNNALLSGPIVAGFFNWLNAATGATAAQYHIIGFSLGAHKAGIVARNIIGTVPYLTGLDPGSGWENNEQRLSPNDAAYVEVIHTNSLIMGTQMRLGHVDFYPNGGQSMPGCVTPVCDHYRSFHYFAESVIRGGFLGRECPTAWDAVIGDCFLPTTLRMGGLVPKNGFTGAFYLRTNRRSPFSRD